MPGDPPKNQDLRLIRFLEDVGEPLLLAASIDANGVVREQLLDTCPMTGTHTRLNVTYLRFQSGTHRNIETELL